MAEPSTYSLAPLFQAVGEALRQNQAALNQADPVNGNHGDHMVEIFEIATQAAQERQSGSLAEAMTHAASLLEAQSDNGSARVYAHGLRQVAEQLRRYDISLDELVAYVQKVLREEKAGGQTAEQPAEPGPARSGEVLKALVAGLANWGQVEEGQASSGSPLNMGALFEFGMAYWQAKQRGGERAAVLADAAAAVSPLSKVPHRYQSGKLAIQALLEAMQREICSRATALRKRSTSHTALHLVASWVLEGELLIIRRRRYRLAFARFAVQHLHLQGNHLGAIAFFAVFFVLVGVQPPFEVNQAAFLEMIPGKSRPDDPRPRY